MDSNKEKLPVLGKDWLNYKNSCNNGHIKALVFVLAEHFNYNWNISALEIIQYIL